MSDAPPRLSRHGPSGRAEFRRLLLDSLIASATSELELHRSRHQRLRARSAERRLEELRRERRELDEDRFTRQSWRWARGPIVGVVVTVLWLFGAALLAAQIVVHGVHTQLTIVGDIVMLVLSLLWFLLAVARVPIREATDDQLEQSGPEAPHG